MFELIALLLQYPNVDPSAGDNELIRVAHEAGYYDVVALLRQDPRIGYNVEL